MLRVMNRMKRVPFPKLYPNLSPAEADLLGIVRSREEGVRVSEIAEALELPMPAVSRLLKSLEERELIVRSVLPRDRRSVVVTVTPQGEQTLQEMKECMHAFLRDSLDGVDPEEFDQMIREWDHLLDRMDALFLRYRQSGTLPGGNDAAAADRKPCRGIVPQAKDSPPDDFREGESSVAGESCFYG